MKTLSTLLVVSLVLLLAGCGQEEPAVPEASEVETPAESVAEPPEPGEANTAAESNEPGAATPGGSAASSAPPAPEEPSQAKKTGETVGGALNTAGETTKKGVRKGLGAVVKGAKKVGAATEDAAKGVASGVKGGEKKE